MKISIVVAYFNRKKLLYETLKSMAKSKFDDFEVIVVDDCSSANERIEDFLQEFPFLKIIRLEPENKWYVNTCVPYNIGIRAATGDIIILQNAECLHVHDIMTYVSKNLNDSNYISISTYALDEKLTTELPKYVNENSVVNLIKALPQNITGTNGSVLGWYNHSSYRPVHYHFCSAITKRNLDLLGGFDERYSFGTSYEDDEFVARIKRMKLNLIIADEVFVIHQWHTPFQYMHPNLKENHARNNALFYGVTLKENIIFADNNLIIKR